MTNRARLETIRTTYGETSLEYAVAKWVVAERARPSNRVITLAEVRSYFAEDSKLKRLHLLTLSHVDNMMGAFSTDALATGGVALRTFDRQWKRELGAKADADKNGLLTKGELQTYLTSLGTGAYLPFDTAEKTVSVPQDQSLLVITDDRMTQLEERLSVLTGEQTLLSANMPGTKQIRGDYETIWHDAVNPTPRMIGYTLTGANFRNRIDVDKNAKTFERSEQCKFYQEPAMSYVGADPDDYALGNKVVRTLTGYVGDVTGDQGHLKNFDSRSDVLAARQSCSLGNNAYQFGETNRQSYRIYEGGEGVLAEKFGKGTIFKGDLFLATDGKTPIPLERWPFWTLGEGKRGAYGVVTYQVVNAEGKNETFVLLHPKTKQPLLFEDVDLKTMGDGTQTYRIDRTKYAAWVAQMKAQFPELAATLDIAKAQVARSLPIPSHRFMTGYWEPDAKAKAAGKRATMTAYIAPNSFTIPTKEYAFSSLVQAPYKGGEPSETNGWRTNVDAIEAMTGVDLYAALANPTEARLERSVTGFPDLDPASVDCLKEDEAAVCTIWPSDRAKKPLRYDAMVLDLEADKLEDIAAEAKKVADEAMRVATELEAAAVKLTAEANTPAQRDEAARAIAAAAAARVKATEAATKFAEKKAAAKAARKAADAAAAPPVATEHE